MWSKFTNLYKCELCGFESTSRFLVETCEKLCKEEAEESNKQEELDCSAKENETIQKEGEQNETQSERC